MNRSPQSLELLEAWARARGLDLSAFLPAAQPGLESLRARLRALGDLPPEAAPPPEGPLAR